MDACRQSVVIEHLRKVAKLIDGSVELTQDTQLLEEQLLDSVELLQLVLELEKHFAISIPLEELVVENFATIGAISSMVDRARSAA